MLTVNCENKKIEFCLKEYRKRLEKSGTHKELMKRKTFTKPSEKRRAQILSAKYRAKYHEDFNI